MQEKVHTISAGSKSVYEIVESADNLTVTIKHAADHSRHVDLLYTALPRVIEALQAIQRSRQISG